MGYLHIDRETLVLDLGHVDLLADTALQRPAVDNRHKLPVAYSLDSGNLPRIVEKSCRRLESFNAAYRLEREKHAEDEGVNEEQRQQKPSPLGDYASDDLMERLYALHLRPFCLCKIIFHDLF